MFESFKRAVSTSFGDWVERYNGLVDKLESLPLPIEHGGNSQTEYIKLANGTVVIWGRIDLGKRYPFTIPWTSTGAGYASEVFTVNFPVPLVDTAPVVVPHLMNTTRFETFCLTVGVTYTQYNGRVWSAATDSGGASVLNLLVIGRWK